MILAQTDIGSPLERIVRHHYAVRYRTAAKIANAANMLQASKTYPDQYANRAQKGRPAAPNETQRPDAKRGSFETTRSTPPTTDAKMGRRATFEARMSGKNTATSNPATSGKARRRRFMSAEVLPMWCLTLELSGRC